MSCAEEHLKYLTAGQYQVSYSHLKAGQICHTLGLGESIQEKSCVTVLFAVMYDLFVRFMDLAEEIHDKLGKIREISDISKFIVNC